MVVKEATVEMVTAKNIVDKDVVTVTDMVYEVVVAVEEAMVKSNSVKY